jgi:hypothetical protein
VPYREEGRRARHHDHVNQEQRDGIYELVRNRIASMSRGDLVAFERGSRNFRIFTVIRLAGALGISFAELFSSVANWHTCPLAPPEFLPGEAPTKAERDQLLIRL